MGHRELAVHIFPTRDYTAYYSDQLQLLFETEDRQVSLFTDNIAVVQEFYSDGTLKEYDIALVDRTVLFVLYLDSFLRSLINSNFTQVYQMKLDKLLYVLYYNLAHKVK